MRGLSLVVASGGHSSSRCVGLLLSRPLLLRSTGSRRAGSVIVAHGPSCSAACGIFPDQGSSPCPLDWQADSPPLRHQGSPCLGFLMSFVIWKNSQPLSSQIVFLLLSLLSGISVTHMLDSNIIFNNFYILWFWVFLNFHPFFSLCFSVHDFC